MIMRSTMCVFLLAAFVVSGSPAARADNYDLLLRLQDAVGVPGGPAVVSLRTYSTRPVGQGTICVAMRGENGAPPPLASFKGARVFSVENDVIEDISVRQIDDEMIIDITFFSPSASVNSIEGPVAALYFELAPDAVPGTKTALVLDADVSELVDANGMDVPLIVRAGELEIRHPNAPRELVAEAHLPSMIGGPITLSLQTNEPFRIASGQVAIHYNSRELMGPPQLQNDARFGEAEIKLDGVPGLAVLKILSSGPDFNELPGNIMSIDLRPGMIFGANFIPYVSLDPAMTRLFDENGNSIHFEIEESVYALPNGLVPPTGQKK